MAKGSSPLEDFSALDCTLDDWQGQQINILPAQGRYNIGACLPPKG